MPARPSSGGGTHTLVGADPDEVAVGNGAAALSLLDQLTPGLWVGWCAFELGHALERVVPRSASLDERSVPDAVFARFGAVAEVGPDGSVAVRGDGNGRRLLERAAADLTLAGADLPGPAIGRVRRAASGGRVSIGTTSKPGSTPSSSCSAPASATR